MLIFNLYFLSSLANPRKTSISRNFSFGSRNRDSIAFFRDEWLVPVLGSGALAASTGGAAVAG